jgi:hypothetical protein
VTSAVCTIYHSTLLYCAALAHFLNTWPTCRDQGTSTWTPRIDDNDTCQLGVGTDPGQSVEQAWTFGLVGVRPQCLSENAVISRGVRK